MAINRRSRTILEEISSFIPNKNKEDLIEARAQHIIASAINLLESIDRSFTEEQSEVLRKRFLSSIKNSDPDKFSRIISKIKNNDFSEDC